MILDTLSNASLYYGVHPLLERGLRYLAETDLASLPLGRHDIDGDRLFAIVQEYETKLPTQVSWEKHRKYTDIQYVVSGVERIGWANADGMKIKEALPEHDAWLLEDHEGDLLLVKEGFFAVFAPQDAHQPSLAAGNASSVRKIVVKVAMNENE